MGSLALSTLVVCLLMVATTVVASSSPSDNAKPPGGINCRSWHLALETNNLRNMQLVPLECKRYVARYMLKGQYQKDCDFVTEEAFKYAQGLKVGKDGRDIWVFDMDETTVSNLPYFERNGFGTLPINGTSFTEWIASGKAPAIPGALRLYKRLVSLGFKIVFLTAADISLTDARARNLKAAGYKTWEKLILKDDPEESSFGYKSRKRQELEEEGYRIRGNGGDQWSDLLGNSTGDRTFKFPNPMYYVA